jgi:hypothetical protein
MDVTPAESVVMGANGSMLYHDRKSLRGMTLDRQSPVKPKGRAFVLVEYQLENPSLILIKGLAKMTQTCRCRKKRVPPGLTYPRNQKRFTATASDDFGEAKLAQIEQRTQSDAETFRGNSGGSPSC